MDAWATVGVGLGSAVIGALAAGGMQVGLAVWDRRIRRRVAARVAFGDIAVTARVFELVVEREQWPHRMDFGAAIAAWKEYRRDFAAEAKAWEWSVVGRFYSSLERTVLMIRAGEPCTENDLKVAASLLEEAQDAARKVVAEHVAKNEKERQEVIERLGAAAHRA